MDSTVQTVEIQEGGETMVMQIEPPVERDPVTKSATMTWERSLISPSTTAICYCGAVVRGRFLCADCSERMSRAFQCSLQARSK